jgi:hypothetical protein
MYDYENLKTHYTEIIGQMPETFTSHAFILKLAQAHQREYIEALYAYRNSETNGTPAPFRVVHGRLSKLLKDFPELIKHMEANAYSDNIFGEPSSCAQWKKVNH